MTSTLSARSADAPHRATARHYLMCRPTYFDVVYAINPWMDISVPTDRELAVRQWESLRDTYRTLGHTVDVIDGIPDQPDMVFAANSGTMIGGKALAANMFSALRRGEQAPYRRWLATAAQGLTKPELVNEGQGDYAWTGRVLLAGTGYRTDPRAHAEASDALGVPVVSLQLVDPRFYHLDTALFVLDHEQVAYFPGAFSDASRAELANRYPNAILATESDALCLGLNAVSDGRHVIIAPGAADLIAELTHRGYQPIPLDLSELLKAGGGAKCCTLEIHS